MGIVPNFDPILYPVFGADMRLAKGRIWISILQGTCIPILEIGVRLLNHQIEPLYLKLWSVSWDYSKLPCFGRTTVQVIGTDYWLGTSKDFDYNPSGNL